MENFTFHILILHVLYRENEKNLICNMYNMNKDHFFKLLNFDHLNNQKDLFTFFYNDKNQGQSTFKHLL